MSQPALQFDPPPALWLPEYSGLKKPGLCVHTLHLQYGPGDLPCVGIVRGIYATKTGKVYVRASFPYTFGAVGTYYYRELSARFPKDWLKHGDWTKLPQAQHGWTTARQRIGAPESAGQWPHGNMPVPEDFYGGIPALHSFD